MIIKNTKLRVAALSLLVVISTTAFAESKPYFGGQLGYGKSGAEDGLDGSGLAGRVFAGYQFNSYFATELGWTRFHNVTDNVIIYDAYDYLDLGYTMKTNALDLVGKGIIPVTSNMDIYGKLGVAYVMQSHNLKIDSSWGGSDSLHANEHAWLPTAGVGASYHFTPKLAADVSYNRIQHVGDTTVGSADFVGAGLTYSFN